MDASIDRDRLRQVAVHAGLTGNADEVQVAPFGGGVSNDVFELTIGDRRVVLKQALPRLRVAAEWLSDVSRIHREADCQRWLQQVLEPGEVPAVLWEDTEAHLYVMERAPLAARNWKDELLAGRLPDEAARRAGDMLGRIHTAGWDRAELRDRYGDQTVFDQLRLDPYLREVARRHTRLAAPLDSLVARLAGASQTIVHGDYSPKNILLCETHNVLLDHEVVHYGEPRFDLAFWFTHLLLKALHVKRRDDLLWQQVNWAWNGYRDRCDRIAEASWLDLLGGILLARVDGKSPAGYLDADEEAHVRGVAARLLVGEAHSLDEAVAMMRGAS